MNFIDILVPGTHAMKDSFTIAPHTGAVTLIRTGYKNILVDTGARGTLPMLMRQLQHFGLSHSDISTIILTHFHLDHSFNVNAFPMADVVGWSHSWQDRKTVRLGDVEALQLGKGIQIIRTPGHAPEHLAVLVEDDNGKTVAIAGDAINHDYVVSKKITAFAYDKALYEKSAEKILSLAETIIPGHGNVITKTKKPLHRTAATVL